MIMDQTNNKTAPGTDCWNSIGVWSHVTERCEKLDEYIHCRNCPVFSDMGRSVFERTAPSGYLTEWRKAIATKGVEDQESTNSVLIFRVKQEWYALPTEILSEVANERPIHRIPRNMNRFISGIVNINGEVKLCYSLEELLDIKVATRKSDNFEQHQIKRLIVINLGDSQYVFLVNEVMSLQWYGESDLTPLPSTLNVNNAELLLGSVRKAHLQVAVFDIAKLQERLEGAVL